MTLPEGRKPLRWQDMPLPDRPKGHPSTERLEIEKLQARVAELEAALRRIADGRFSLAPAPDYVTEPHKSPKEIARAALKGERVMSDDLVKRLRQSWDVNRSIMSQTGQWMTERDEAAARIEALEARVAAADKLAEAVTHEREMVCQDFGMQQDAATAVHNALAAYQTTKERE